MGALFDRHLAQLAAHGNAKVFSGGKKGLEKEALRIASDGHLAQTAHPAALGSALTNRFITTDFSESLLEFVTPAFSNSWETVRFLCDIHQFTYERLDDELLWVTSMPCAIAHEDDIQLARYGSSNLGRMKTLYRSGLALRYGRLMQSIAGIHFNYSAPETFWTAYQEICKERTDLPDCRSQAYLGLIRNFRRLGWLVLYLFGSSPALCRRFAENVGAKLEALDKNTLFEPWGTSLRMSDLGYSNKSQAGVNISLNSLDEYISDLRRAIRTPEPRYEALGVKVDGEYRQLNANLLQIENEYYSPIRPKRVIRPGEKPTAALERAGIEYVEVRSLDINVFDPVGISQNELRFIEAFLLYCLVEESPFFSDQEYREAGANHALVARRGREPGLKLQCDGKALLLTDWASEVLEKVAAIAELLDKETGSEDYAATVRDYRHCIADSEATPSARLLAELRTGQVSFAEFALQSAKGHRDYFRSLVPVQSQRLAEFETEVAESVERQKQIEASDSLGFDDYLANYLK